MISRLQRSIFRRNTKISLLSKELLPLSYSINQSTNLAPNLAFSLQKYTQCSQIQRLFAKKRRRRAGKVIGINRNPKYSDSHDHIITNSKRLNSRGSTRKTGPNKKKQNLPKSSKPALQGARAKTVETRAPAHDEQYLSFEHLGLLRSIKDYLEKHKIHAPTSIQSSAIAEILDTNHSLFIGSPTGSGKTLTFLIPIFQILKKEEIEASREPDISDVEIKEFPKALEPALPYHFQYLSESEKAEFLEYRKFSYSGRNESKTGGIEGEGVEEGEESRKSAPEYHKNSMRITLSCRPRAIIVVPSKELVQQITLEAKQLGKFCKLGVLGLGIKGNKDKMDRMKGGDSFKGMFKREKELLVGGVDILIGTPNR